MSRPPSPREWLLARHEAVAVRLDAIRLSRLPPEPCSWRDFLRELFLPQRTAWTALAAVWVALGIVHLAQRSTRSVPTAVPPRPEAVAEWLRQIKSHESLAQAYRRP